MTHHALRHTRSVEQAAEWLGISRRKLYDEIADGRLATFKIGRRRLVSERALEDYIRRMEKEASSA